ncbi:hypothetical protein FCU94_13770 [Vibrio sp. JPW-9-11-11]|uniref:hypothetical protein n=1 Tax=Vibrio sp. JPW-9-11-11 TaxID=1416532 RepID=UPI001592B7E8|nr:hypothetical protein [Vibrio sp. JPW-9-11-11]NVD07955.1 hypothetical protein [Vibrio sp. JPW-9-11-11]
MNGDISYLYQGERNPFEERINMTQQQFELMKSQLKTLTPQQLRVLKGAINSTLNDTQGAIISDEEMKMIASLFS